MSLREHWARATCLSTGSSGIVARITGAVHAIDGAHTGTRA